MIDEGEGPERTVEGLTARILGINFGLIQVGDPYVMPSYLTLIDPSMLRTDGFRSMCRISYCNLTSLTDVALQSFTHALFCLAANSQYLQPLREEVEAIIQKDGWSKASLAKMRKVDSFLKECQRMKGVNLGTYFHISLVHLALDHLSR